MYARHLKRTLTSYFAYYRPTRTHLGLDEQCPYAPQVSGVGRIVNAVQCSTRPAADGFLAKDLLRFRVRRPNFRCRNPAATANQESSSYVTLPFLSGEADSGWLQAADDLKEVAP